MDISGKYGETQMPLPRIIIYKAVLLHSSRASVSKYFSGVKID